MFELNNEVFDENHSGLDHSGRIDPEQEHGVKEVDQSSQCAIQ